jgi:hypothetical protein
MVLIVESHSSQFDESFKVTREDDDAERVYSDIMRLRGTFTIWISDVLLQGVRLDSRLVFSV